MKCEYCDNELTLNPEENYLYCEHCGDFDFPEENLDGVVVLSEAAEHLCCPLCREPLNLAAIADYEVLHCGQCWGVYLSNATFRVVIDALRGHDMGPRGTPQPIDPKDYERMVNCPECQLQMETHPYYGPGAVVIDSCARCHMLWLDHGELKAVIDASSR